MDLSFHEKPIFELIPCIFKWPVQFLAYSSLLFFNDLKVKICTVSKSAKRPISLLPSILGADEKANTIA
jgi:hypothetical protein